MVLGEIQGYIKSRLIYARLVLGLFSHILHNVRHIETYLPTFSYILADSGIFKNLVQLDIFTYVQAYSEPGLFGIVSQ